MTFLLLVSEPLIDTLSDKNLPNYQALAPPLFWLGLAISGKMPSMIEVKFRNYQLLSFCHP